MNAVNQPDHTSCGINTAPFSFHGGVSCDLFHTIVNVSLGNITLYICIGTFTLRIAIRILSYFNRQLCRTLIESFWIIKTVQISIHTVSGLNVYITWFGNTINQTNDITNDFRFNMKIKQRMDLFYLKYQLEIFILV